MNLELQSDLENVKGSYAEPGTPSAREYCLRAVVIAYLDTRPARAPAVTTCNLEP